MGVCPGHLGCSANATSLWSERTACPLATPAAPVLGTQRAPRSYIGSRSAVPAAARFRPCSFLRAFKAGESPPWRPCTGDSGCRSRSRVDAGADAREAPAVGRGRPGPAECAALGLGRSRGAGRRRQSGIDRSPGRACDPGGAAVSGGAGEDGASSAGAPGGRARRAEARGASGRGARGRGRVPARAGLWERLGMLPQRPGRGSAGLCSPVTRTYLRLSHRNGSGGPCRVLSEGLGALGMVGSPRTGERSSGHPPPGSPAAPSRGPRAAVPRRSARQAKPAPRGGEGRGRGGGVGCAPREPAGPCAPRSASRPYGLRGGGGRSRGKSQRPARRGRRLPKGRPGARLWEWGSRGRSCPPSWGWRRPLPRRRRATRRPFPEPRPP